MVNIEISDFVKAELEEIKEREGHKSLDSVVRVLLERSKRERPDEGRMLDGAIRYQKMGIKK